MTGPAASEIQVRPKSGRKRAPTVAVPASPLGNGATDPPSRHPFAGLQPGRIVHYVMRSGECRGAFVAYVFRAKGRMVEAGSDERVQPPAPILRQEWLLPDAGHCALQVELHPAFDRDDLYPEQPQSGRWFRESIPYAPAPEWEEDADPGTWHWPHEHLVQSAQPTLPTTNSEQLSDRLTANS